MKKIEPIKKSGHLTAYIIDPKWHGQFPTRSPKHEWPVLGMAFEKQNQILQIGQSYSYLNGLKFTWIAGGTGSNAVSPSDKQLQTEIQRFEVFDVSYAPGLIEAYAEIPPDTGNITWSEWGVVLADGMQTRGSGTFYSRLLQEYTKSFGDTILLNYTLEEELL